MRNKFGIAVVVAIILVGCAGTDFKRLETSQLTYGSDTPETVKQKLGKTYMEGFSTVNDIQIEYIGYAYASMGGTAAYEGVVAGRNQIFYFYENKLVGQYFTSTWEIDSTDFDETKVGEIEKGTTTTQEVIEVFGNPNGEFIFPLVKNETERALVYIYVQTKKEGLMSTKSSTKKLVVSYDENGIVTDVEYTFSGEK